MKVGCCDEGQVGGVSYDVSISGGDSFNITSNMREMFQAFRCYPPDWAGLPAGDVGRQIAESVKRIADSPVSYLDEFDAPNGWGTWQVTLHWLMQVRDACLRSPDSIVEVSA